MNDFEIVRGKTKALLAPNETVLLSHYASLACDASIAKSYPTFNGFQRSSDTTNPRRSIDYEYPTWSSYSDVNAPCYDKGSTCCNSCAMILVAGARVVPCDGCIRMTYCSDACKTTHKANGHDRTVCDVMQRMEQNNVTKGELLSILNEIPKEEDYDTPLFVNGAVVSTVQLNDETKEARKSEKKFVRTNAIDFGKVIHELVRVECATCGGKGNQYDDDDDEERDEEQRKKRRKKRRRVPVENDVGDRIAECNSFSNSSSIFPRFERLPPLDKKMVLIANSYLDALNYDDKVDLDLFDCRKISKSLIDTYNDALTSASTVPAGKDAQIGWRIGFGGRRRYPGPRYYGGPYGWGYGDGYYGAGIGYNGYYGNPRLGYYRRSHGRRW